MGRLLLADVIVLQRRRLALFENLSTMRLSSSLNNFELKLGHCQVVADWLKLNDVTVAISDWLKCIVKQILD